jgi:hypothetical protein
MRPIQLLIDEPLLRRLDADPEVRQAGRSEVLWRAAREYLRRWRPLPPDPQGIEADPVEDPVEPGPRVAARLVEVGVAEGPQQRLLHEILGLVGTVR